MGRVKRVRTMYETGKNKASATANVLLSFFIFFPPFPFFSFFFFFCSTTVRRSLALVCYADFSSTDVKGLKVFAAGNNKLCRASGNSWRGHRAKLSRRSSPGILCSTMLLPLSDSINER